MNHDWDGIYSEQALLDKWGLTPRQLMDLRARGLPYIAVNRMVRLYEEGATVAFLVGLLRSNA